MNKSQLNKHIVPLVRYALGSVSVLGLKLIITWLLLNAATLLLAYLFVHIAVFFISYAIHARWSFRVPFSLFGVRDYFKTVIAFKIVDYLLFSVFFKLFNIEALWCVVLATLAVALVRFVFVKQALSPNEVPGEAN